MQKVFNYRIFNRVVRFKISATLSTKQLNELMEPLSLYPEATAHDKPMVEVEFTDLKGEEGILSTNPATHSEIAHGFIMHHPKYNISVMEGTDGPKFIIALSPKRQNVLMRFLSRLYSMDYATIMYRLSQLLFEQVLAPSVFFFPQQLLVHSSSMVTPDGRAIIIGGSGGVGKTSLEIELCMNRGYSFMADDMSIIDTDGYVYPNLAFPKIYAYNTRGNTKLKRKIFKGRPLGDRLAWHFKCFFFGRTSARRKISPKKLFDNYAHEKAKIWKYFILIKENREDVLVSKIDATMAARLTYIILKTEYLDFINHILWHQFYCNAKGVKPVLCMDDLYERWQLELVKVFEQVDTSIIFIPSDMEHRRFIQSVADVITSH